MRKYREKQRCDAPVTHRDACDDTETYTDTDTDTRTTLSGKARRPPCEVCEQALSHLNKRTGKRYRLVGQTAKKLHRCHTAASKNTTKALDACLSVIDWLCDSWGSDPKMAPYLRPSTIFATTKFAQRWEEIQAGAAPTGGTGRREPA